MKSEERWICWKPSSPNRKRMPQSSATKFQQRMQRRRPQQNSAASAAPELSRHTASKSADEGSLLIHIPGNEASPSNTPAQQSPALQSPNRHIERLKEQVTQSTDTPWPGICHISSPTTQKAQMPWPGLEMSQTSTAEAEGPTLVRTGSDSPPEGLLAHLGASRGHAQPRLAAVPVRGGQQARQQGQARPAEDLLQQQPLHQQRRVLAPGSRGACNGPDCQPGCAQPAQLCEEPTMG